MLTLLVCTVRLYNITTEGKGPCRVMSNITSGKAAKHIPEQNNLVATYNFI